MKALLAPIRTLGLCLALALPLSSSANLAVNGSFESGLAGWSTNGNVSSQSGAPYITTDGTKLAAFNALNSSNNGVMSQVIPVTPGRLHTLQFDAGNLSYNSSPQTIHMDVVAGSTSILAADLVISSTGGGSTHWLHGDYSFTTNLNEVTLVFRDASTATNAVDLVLDNVKVEKSSSMYVSSNLDFPGPGPNITITPQSLDHLGGGVTSYYRYYKEGEPVTLTAPATSGGKNFHEWAKDGVHLGSNTSVTVNATGDMNMRAIYNPVIWLGAGVSTPALEVRGTAGAGPFSPLSSYGQIFNDSSSEVEWSAIHEATGGSPSSSWLSIWPIHGTIPPFGYAQFRMTVTGSTLELPAGLHTGRILVSTPLGNAEMATHLTAISPSQLLQNGSFESLFSAWAQTGNVAIQTAPAYQSTDGRLLAVFNGVNSLPNGTLGQTFTAEPDVLYSVDFDYGALAYNSNLQKLRVQVKNAANPGSSDLADQTFSVSGTGGGSQHWLPGHLQFTAPASQIEIVFSDVSTTSTSIDLLLDNIRVKAPNYDLTVTTLADESDGAPGLGTGDSLRELIQEANTIPGPNRIHFAPALNGQTITLGSGGPLIPSTPLAIDASSLPDGITISGGGVSRVFRVDNNSVFRNLTVTGGGSDTPVPDSEKGSGIANYSELMLARSKVQGNNSVMSGGGIINYGFSTLVVDHSEISGNHATNDGGGISTSGETRIFNSTISGNTSGNHGGGIGGTGRFGTAWTILMNSTVSGNSAISGGGYSGVTGYKLWATMLAANTTFSNNTAVQSGGGITGNNDVDLRNCTVSGNSCTAPDGEGGGVYSAALRLENSIVAGNTASTGSQISGYSLVEAGTNFTSGDPMLAPLSDNGGGTLTMRPLPGSPVLNAAGNPPDQPATDQRGKRRITAGAMDIGAFEEQEILVNTLVDENDGIGVGGISLRDAVALNQTGVFERIGFVPSLSGGTILLGGTNIFSSAPVNIDASDLPGGITVSGNHASGVFRLLFGGGSIRGMTITGSAGSAITVGDALLNLTDCILQGNTTTGSGGALDVQASLGGFAIIRNCTFADNSASLNGGAISNTAIINVWNSTFTGNHAGGVGGAISSGMYRSGMVCINSTFAGNSASGNGGAIHAASFELIHSTLSGNSSTGGTGGGLASFSPVDMDPRIGATITNSIIAGNTATSQPDLSGTINALYGTNFIGGNPLLAPLANYGGKTRTMPPLPGSPVIDGAVILPATPPFDGSFYTNLGTDQLGHARPSGPLPDIGAVEAFPFSSLPPVDTDGDGIDDRLEPAYGLVVGIDNSTRDSDGDGSSDADEIANMTDPLDPASIFKITSFVPASGFNPAAPVYDVTFSTFPGLSYSLECHSGLGFGGPGTVTYPSGVAGGFSSTFSIPMAAGHDFVRVARQP